MVPNAEPCGVADTAADTAQEASVTGLLLQWGSGDRDAFNRLVPLVYHELRHLARSHLHRSGPEQTLQATGLVHEVYLRLSSQAGVRIESRAHFYAIAAHLMRCVLVDHARRRCAAKRGGGRVRVDADQLVDLAEKHDHDLIAVHEALTALAAIDPLKSRVVELRFFGGLNVEDVGEVLNLSPRTVARQWAMAKAWLYGAIQRGATPGREHTLT